MINIRDKNCILFCRVSSREQEETGYSLPAQETYLKSYTDRNRLNVKKVFNISESASGRKARVEFNHMLDYVRKQNINVIICEKVDRLTRNQKDAVTIDDWVKEDVFHEVHFVKNTFILNKESKASDKFVWNIHVSQAQFNIENLSEEVKKGQNEKISEGWYPSQAPVGYRSGLDGKKKTIELDPNTAPLMERVLVEYSTGVHSVLSICRFAQKIGLRNLKGNFIAKTSMHRMLQNPFYYGMFTWNKASYVGNHPAIIDKDTFDKIQKYLKRKTPLVYRQLNALYSGILHCNDCGRLITWESHKGHQYGYCKGCRGKRGVKEPEINKPIQKLFGKAKIHKKRVADAVCEGVISYVKNSYGIVGKSNAQIEKDIEKYSSRLSKLYDDRADGLLTPEMYSNKFSEYNNTLTDLRIQLKENSQHKEFFDIEGFKQFFEASQNLELYYEKATKDERRKLLKFAFEDIAYANNGLGYNFSKAYSLLYKAVEITNSSEIKNIKELQEYISEPDELVASKTKNDSFRAIRSFWLGDRDSNPNRRDQNPQSYR